MKTADAEFLADVQRRSYSVAGAAVTGTWPATRALDSSTLLAFIGRQRYAVLATSRADGRPQAAPVGFVVARRSFWIATIAGSRLRNVRVVPWAALVLMEDRLVDDGSREHAAVRVEGPVRIHEQAVLEAARRRLESDWRSRYDHGLGWAAAILELKPERLFSFSTAESPSEPL